MKGQKRQDEDRSAATLELKHPIEWGSDGLITELHFRRPRFKDIRETESKSDAVTAMNLISRLTGMPPPFVDEMDAEDFMEAGNIVKGFMPKSREDGDSGSEPSQDS